MASCANLRHVSQEAAKPVLQPVTGGPIVLDQGGPAEQFRKKHCARLTRRGDDPRAMGPPIPSGRPAEDAGEKNRDTDDEPDVARGEQRHARERQAIDPG